MTMSATPCARATPRSPDPLDAASAPAPAPMKVSVKVPIISAVRALEFMTALLSVEKPSSSGWGAEQSTRARGRGLGRRYGREAPGALAAHLAALRGGELGELDLLDR